MIACAFVGRLVRDAKVLETKAGKPWVSLNLRVEPVDWVSAAYFGDIAAISELKEGAQVFIEGRLTLRRWQNHAGHQMSGLDVVASFCRPVAGIKRPPEAAP